MASQKEHDLDRIAELRQQLRGQAADPDEALVAELTELVEKHQAADEIGDADELDPLT